jgi:hypothetical protein
MARVYAGFSFLRVLPHCAMARAREKIPKLSEVIE